MGTESGNAKSKVTFEVGPAKVTEPKQKSQSQRDQAENSRRRSRPSRS